MFNKILVTGGAGYVGYSVIEELIKNYPTTEIIIYDNFSKGRLEGISNLLEKSNLIKIIPWEKADIRDESNLRNVLKENKPEVVIHLAAIVDAFTTNRKGKDEECLEVNYKSTVSVAKISKEEGVKIFIYQSTCSIYSKGKDIHEESPINPLSTYGKAKLLAEKEILTMNDDSFKICCLRPATVVGYNPCFRYETIINLMCIRSIYKVPINIFESALNNEKTYLYTKDNASAIIFAIENIDSLKGQCFNVSSFNVNLDTVLKILKENLNEEFPYYIVPEKTINQQVYTISSKKLRAMGFNPKGEIDCIIKETIKNLKKNKKLILELTCINNT